MITALTLDVLVGETVSIDGGRVTATLLEKSGQRAKLRFMAEESIRISKVPERKPGAQQAIQGVNLPVV